MSKKHRPAAAAPESMTKPSEALHGRIDASEKRPLVRIGSISDFERAFSVPRETVERLTIYEALLRQWQKATNLVAPSTLDEVWSRHFADSAQLVALAPHAANWLDLGSGAGFPGLVIAIIVANHDTCSVHLVESNSRKCAFLSEVARRTGVRITIHESRIEDAARGGRVKDVDVVTARALAPLDRLLDLAEGFFSDTTIGLFLKGREAPREIEEAQGRRNFSFCSIPSRVNGEGSIVQVRRVGLSGGISS
jgi:16S rRNA (guanine527-N7)-methyltransferase